MTSLILRTATRYLFPIIMLFSIYLLLRGHNEPGGGFVGGLAAASAYTLYSLAFDVNAARKLLRIDSRSLTGIGLLISTTSGLLSTFQHKPFLTSWWGKIPVADDVYIYVGTPLFFDLGVYCVVLGVTVTIIHALSETEKEIS